jgi:hypothetical protein
MTDAASVRAKLSPNPIDDSSSGIEMSFGVAWVTCNSAMRTGAIRPFSVICATIPSTSTTTSERKLPRPSRTSAREPQPFDSTMP